MEEFRESKAGESVMDNHLPGGWGLELPMLPGHTCLWNIHI